MTREWEWRGIKKAFSGRTVLDGVSLSLDRGEVLGLLGENGAGKTTLMNIFYGLYRADAGTWLKRGEPVVVDSPKAAVKLGVGMVHQHFMLIPTLTVQDNIALFLKKSPFWRGAKDLRERILSFGKSTGLEVNPDALVRTLSAGELQRVEILKALLNGAELLILDEPTSVLSPPEAESLYRSVEAMRREGKSVILISHKMQEILSVCTRAAVLRKGQLVLDVPVAQTDAATLALEMIGREWQAAPPLESRTPGEVILDVQTLAANDDAGRRAVHGVSFQVRQGEILGVAGVSGNGQRELAEAITGLRQVVSGKVYMDGEDVTNQPVKNLGARGMAHVPEERMRFGVVPNLLLFENAVLNDYHSESFSDAFFLKHREMRAHTEMIIENFRVAAPGTDHPTKHLSGGNIQKLILGREISGDPTLLVAAHPTYGLDVAAAEAVRSELLKRRRHGGAVLLLSEDLDEILQLSDRVAVLFRGRLMGILDRGEADPARIGLWMAGEEEER